MYRPTHPHPMTNTRTKRGVREQEPHFPQAEAPPGEYLGYQTTLKEKVKSTMGNRMEIIETLRQLKQDRLIPTIRQLPPHHQPTAAQPNQPPYPIKDRSHPPQRNPPPDQEIGNPRVPHYKNGVRETVLHYLLTCPSYRGARQLLQAILKCDTNSIPFLTSTRKGIPHLLRYINNTKRLTATFGDVRPDDNFELKEKETKKHSRRQHEEDEE